MSDDPSDTAFVFAPDASYGLVQQIRSAGAMPVAGLRYVASVTGPWKIVKIVTFDGLGQLADRLESLSEAGDPPTAISFGRAQVKRSEYRTHTAFIRIDVRVDDPRTLIDEITGKIGSDEADAVTGDFDIFACVTDDEEDELMRKILAVRAIDGVKRTTSLRVIDYVSTSADAPDDHRVEPA
jgi:DNA-binding Lrp family transcriptional regulator